MESCREPSWVLMYIRKIDQAHDLLILIKSSMSSPSFTAWILAFGMVDSEEWNGQKGHSRYCFSRMKIGRPGAADHDCQHDTIHMNGVNGEAFANTVSRIYSLIVHCMGFTRKLSSFWSFFSMVRMFLKLIYVWWQLIDGGQWSTPYHTAFCQNRSLPLRYNRRVRWQGAMLFNWFL